MMLDNNGRLGHKWSAAPLRAQPSSSSATDAAHHLQSPVEKISVLWKVGDIHTTEEFAKLFHQLRAEAICKGAPKEWIESNVHRFEPPYLRQCLKRFKPRASTGSDWLPLKPLRDAPDDVLAALGATLQQTAVHLVGPSVNLPVTLDLLEKKGSGFRTTATFASHWRLITSVLLEDYREFDKQQGLPFDTAMPGRSPSQ